MLGGDLGTFEISDVEQIRLILQEAERQSKLAEDEQEYCEKKTQDILHQMELEDLSYHERARLATELTEIRRRRRIAKDTYEMVWPVVAWKADQSGPLIKLNNVIGKMRTAYEKQQNAVYFKKADGKGDMIPHKC